jgi:4-hydroxybenzoate polyprenyltransferase
VDGLNVKSDLPLAVDLDRTLIRTDLGVESLVACLVARPWVVFLIPFWLLCGLAHTKRRLLDGAVLDLSAVPAMHLMEQYVRDAHNAGRKTLLVTASDQSIADAAAARFPWFSEAIGSNGVINLKGPNKAKLLRERFGERGFVYAGDSRADLEIWKVAAAAVVVDSTGGVRTKQAANLCAIEQSFDVTERARLKVWISQLRVRQWAKNLLLFLPLFLAHEVGNSEKWISTIWAAISFSLVASAVYIFNDASDLAADRTHASKRHRPLASGEIKLETALLAAVALLVCAVVMAILLVPQVFPILAGYFLLTTLYTWWAKEQLGLDVIMLAGLYCIRIFAGGSAADVELSRWLICFTGFLFVSLACVKRVSELAQLAMLEGKTVKLRRRAYSVADLPVLTAVGVGAGLVGVLVAALYFSGAEVTALYSHPTVLFAGVLPALTAWFIRVWLLAGRGAEALEDPVVFAITDRFSLLCGALVTALVIFAV